MLKRKFTYVGTLLALCFSFALCFPLHVKAAADKVLSAELKKDFVAATFTITSSDFDMRDCSVTIVSPQKKEYEVTDITVDRASININDITAGSWKIIISSDTLPSIGKVDITIEGAKNAIVDQNEQIAVAANISGLKLYMKDNYLVVEWADNSCGSINIQVLDSSTFQVLDSASVSERDSCYYEFKVPDKLPEVLVTVVPATSASIQGATSAFTLSTYNEPNAYVTFPSINVTNQAYMKFNATLGGTYALRMEMNGREVDRTEYLSAGDYEFEVPVVEGINAYTVYAIDENGYMKSHHFSLIGDYMAPTLTVTDSNRTFVTDVDTYIVKGTIKDFVSLSINEKPVANIYDDGVFEYEYLLHEGENTINILAMDEAGNYAASKIVITYALPESPSILKTLGIPLCIIALFFIVVYGAKLAKGRNEEEIIVSTSANKSSSKKIEKKPKQKGRFYWLFTPVLLLATYYVIMKYCIAMIFVTSSSMEPLLKTGDVVFFNRLSYVDEEVKRGDVVCFWSDEEGCYVGKRIIGMPGDEISFVDGYVCINGDVMDESSYVKNDLETNCDKSFKVPEGSYFVLGDNREVSKDSRYLDNPYIKAECILGKYMGSSGINLKRIIQ